MKTQKRQRLKAALSLLLTAGMLSGTAGTVMAAGGRTEAPAGKISDVNGDGVITYVAFGDSVTNGYGMEGYRYDDGGNTYGFRREVETSYPVMVRDYLIKEFGEGNVELEQLAISGFRMDELHCMLDEDFVGDDYHYKYFDSWFETLRNRWRYYEEDDYYAKYNDSWDARDIFRAEYTTAVENADLITIDLGTNNFGTFMTNQLQVLLGIGGFQVEMDFTQFMDEASYASMDAILTQMVAGIVGDANPQTVALAKTLATTLMYGYLGYTTHFDAAMEKIIELNPDAQVVIVDVYSMMSGVAMTGETFGENVDMSTLYGLFVDMANLYTRELSPYAQYVTHATLDEDPELFFDYYADYPDDDYTAETAYLNPSAFRLLNEFIMENMRYDPDYPDEREAFEKNVMTGINTLDALVGDIENVVYDNIVKALETQIVAGVQTAVNGVDTAIEGVELIRKAVDGVEQINTAVSGVATAQDLVNTIVGSLSDYSNMLGGMFESMIIGKIEETINDEMMISLGFEPTEANRTYLAEEVYEIACLYFDTEDKEGKDAANKAAVIEAIRFILESKGTPASEAAETAETAYMIAEVYNRVLETTGSEEKAMIAVLAAQLGDEETAASAYAVANVYNYTLANGGTEDDAMVAALNAYLGNEALAQQAYALYQLAQYDYDQAVIAAIMTEYPDENLAAAMYRVYCAVKSDDKIDEEDFILLLTTLSPVEIDETQAAALHACYLGDRNGKWNDPAVQTTVALLMVLNGNASSAAEAAEMYGQYMAYKRMPEIFAKIAKNKAIYIDYLLAASADGINFEKIAAGFMNGTLSLEYPGDDATEAELQKFYTDSSLATTYMRFISQDGVFIHPNEVGQESLAKCVIKALKNLISDAEEDEDIHLAEDAVLLSIGDSMVASTLENNYTVQIADLLGIEDITYVQSNGARLEDFYAALDSSCEGDAYSAAVSVPGTLDDSIENSDVILVNVGSMNLGFSALQLQRYLTTGETYAMKFGTLDNMEHRDLGEAVDNLLAMVQGGVLNGGNPAASAVAPVLLLLESYGYGITTFTESFNDLMDEITALNPDAAVVLVGITDLLGDAYYHDPATGAYFGLGDFFMKAVDLMNGHMKIYAERTANVFYIDTLEAENNSSALNLADSNNVAAAMAGAHFTVNGHTAIAENLTSEPAHIFCLEEIDEEQGVKIYGCAFCDKSYTEELPKACVYSIPDWTWEQDEDGVYTAVSLKFLCEVHENCENTSAEYDAVLTSESTATCTEDGILVYTASVTINDTEYTDSREEAVSAAGHTYEDGICSGCGEAEPVEPDPEPDEPEEGECSWTENVSLADGTFEMRIGYVNVGEFTFAAAEGGWTIQAEDGRYAAIVDNKFAYTDAPFVWTYASGRFQKTVTTQSSSSNNKWGGNWGGNWGSWFDKYYGSSSKSTTYYLVASGDDLGVSTSANSATVELYITRTGEHNWSEPVSVDRVHIITCTICSAEQSEFCDDETCELCSQIVSVNVSVEVTSTSGSSNSGWRDQFFGSSRKTYTAKIQAEAQGAEIEGVFYSTNGRTWKSGTSFTSSRNITSFQIRIDLSNDESYYFQYRNGTVSAK